MSQSSITQQAQELRARFSRRGVFPIKAGGSIAALDWDGPVLRAAIGAGQKGNALISRYATEPLESPLDFAKPDGPAAGAALAQALQKMKIKPGAVVMSIPRGQVFLRTLSLPKPATDDELSSMVYFQISKDIPFRAEEAVIDFQVNELAAPPALPAANGKAGEEPAAPAKIEVLVAVVKKEVVAFYEAIAHAAGLKLAALGLDSYANVRGLSACGLAAGARAVALVSLRHSEVIIDVMVGDSLVFSRTAGLSRPEIPGAGQSDAGETPKPQPDPAAAAAERLNTITIEVVRSLHNYEGVDCHQKVEKILVAGENGQEEAIVAALAQRCGLPCERLDPTRLLGSEKVSGGAGALTVYGLAVAALDQRAWPFDFLHPKRPPAPRNLRRARLVTAGVAALILICCLAGVRQHLINKRIKIRDEVQAQIARESKNKPIYREMRVKSKTVHDWMTDKREWLDHYAYLSMLLPSCSDVYVTSISTGSRGVLHLSIQARSGEILSQMDKPLRQAGYEIKPLAVTPSSDKFGYSFQSSLELTSPEKMKTNVAGLKLVPRPGDDGSLEAAKRGRRNR